MSPSRKLLINLLAAATFFPYLTPVPTPFSLQPYSLVLALLLLITTDVRRITLPLWLWMPFVSLAGAFLVAPMGADPLNAMRSIYNYLSFAVLLPVYVYLLRNDMLDLRLWLRVAAAVYAFSAVMQIYVTPTFMSCCVANFQDQAALLDSGRGVSSLAPEPTFYGFAAGVMVLISLIRRDRVALLINAASLVVLSRSSLAILCLALAFFAYALVKANLKVKIATAVTVLAVIVWLQSMLSSDLRIVALINLFLEGGINAVVSDQSSSGRLYHIIEPLRSFFGAFGLPHGYGGLPNGDPRILSGFGSAIYELGFVSFPLLYVILRAYVSAPPTVRPVRTFHFVFLVLAWINANQLGMPLFLLYLALLVTGGAQALPAPQTGRGAVPAAKPAPTAG